jgi:hypothetical protein
MHSEFIFLETQQQFTLFIHLNDNLVNGTFFAVIMSDIKRKIL